MRRSSRFVALLSCWLLVAALLCACSGAGATNPAPAAEEVAPVAWAERLDRGTVAVAQEDGVYLSWRLLATDAQDVAFDVYWEDELVATVDGATNYLDANGSAGDEYRVVPAGEEPADAATAVLPDQVLHIPLDPPKPGVTPDGASYSYTAGDATCADLDGDGQYELVLVWDPTNARDSALPGFTGNVFVDAYTLGGERLWRMDLGPNIVAGPHFTQVGRIGATTWAIAASATLAPWPVSTARARRLWCGAATMPRPAQRPSRWWTGALRRSRALTRPTIPAAATRGWETTAWPLLTLTPTVATRCSAAALP